MSYKIVEDAAGKTIKEGEVVELSVMARTEEDSVVWSSADYDRPALVKRERSLFKGDLFAALGLLSEGDSAVVRINIDSMELRMGVPRPGATKGKHLVYSMRIEHVVHKGKLSDSLYAIEVDKFLKARLERLELEEPGKIRRFIAGGQWMATGSGLQYSWVRRRAGDGQQAGDLKRVDDELKAGGLNQADDEPKTGNLKRADNGHKAGGLIPGGPVPMPGDTMEVRYTGMLMSGKVIAPTNVEKIVYGMYGTIPGFMEMLLLMPKGSKVKALIPSALAYGREGRDGSIQAYTPLVYEMEMVDIIHSRGRGL